MGHLVYIHWLVHWHFHNALLHFKSVPLVPTRKTQARKREVVNTSCQGKLAEIAGQTIHEALQAQMREGHQALVRKACALRGKMGMQGKQTHVQQTGAQRMQLAVGLLRKTRITCRRNFGLKAPAQTKAAGKTLMALVPTKKANSLPAAY